MTSNPSVHVRRLCSMADSLDARGGGWQAEVDNLRMAAAEIERLTAEVGRLTTDSVRDWDNLRRGYDRLRAALEHPLTLTPHNDWEVVSGNGGPRQRCRICGWLGLPVDLRGADTSTKAPSKCTCETASGSEPGPGGGSAWFQVRPDVNCPIHIGGIWLSNGVRLPDDTSGESR